MFQILPQDRLLHYIRWSLVVSKAVNTKHNIVGNDGIWSTMTTGGVGSCFRSGSSTVANSNGTVDMRVWCNLCIIDRWCTVLNNRIYRIAGVI